jgi:hypothetical protein
MWRLIYWAFPQLVYPTKLAPRCLFPYVFIGGTGVGDLVTLADAARAGAAGVVVGSAIRLLQRKMLVCAGIPTTMFRWSPPFSDG